MRQVGPDQYALAELRVAIRTIPAEHLQGFCLDGVTIESVQRGDTGLFEHYLLRTTTANVFLVLVRDRVSERFYGYHLLGCNTKDGPVFPYSGGPKME
jgi:hypothetical protein